MTILDEHLSKLQEGKTFDRVKAGRKWFIKVQARFIERKLKYKSKIKKMKWEKHKCKTQECRKSVQQKIDNYEKSLIKLDQQIEIAKKKALTGK